MGRCYQYLTEKQLDGEMSDFPPLDVKRCEREANSLFKTWLFVKDTRGMREITCSRCGHSEQLLAPLRTMDEKWAQLLYSGHDEPATCPWCGAAGRIKERRYIRDGVRLLEYRPVLFLQEKDGVLYAQGFWTRKQYNGKMTAAELGQAPLFMETEACRFRIGRADGYERSGYDGKYYRETVEGNYGRNHWLHEPFSKGDGLYMGYEPYTVFGFEALQRSELKYCQYAMYRGVKNLTEGSLHYDLIKYLTVCTQYPQQVERMMKAGWRELVRDLIVERKKNAAILKWSEPDLRKAIALSGDEFKAWRDSGTSPYRIGDYKKLKRAGVPASFAEIEELHRVFGWEHESGIKYCARFGLRPGRLARYIDERAGKGKDKEWAIPTAAIAIWRDYVDTSEKLGYDLRNETVLLPKQLGDKHDEVVAEMNRKLRRLAREQERLEKLAAAERLEKWRKKYAAEIDGFLFRPAESSQEVIDEGKALQHCVGGYAERHMAGKLTICFVRRIENPEASLYTVEMHGAELIQIHGFKNERIQGAKDPRRVLGKRLDRWLAWVAGGSKRDKQGKPVLPTIKTKEAKTA